MWIRTQNRQRLVNSDQTIDIFIDNTGTKIMAETTSKDRDFFVLGEYKDRDTSLRVINSLYYELEVLSSSYVMPLGGEV